jgi:hypothetical protein
VRLQPRFASIPLPDLPVVASSDAHCPDEVGRCVTVLQVAEPSFDELRLALRGAAGRALHALSLPAAVRQWLARGEADA